MQNIQTLPAGIIRILITDDKDLWTLRQTATAARNNK
jgi:hypothetical protein